MTMPELLDLTPDELRALLSSWDQPAYRAAQILRWVYQRGATSYDDMTNLPAALRARLSAEVSFGPPSVIINQVSADGSTTKVLLRLADGNTVETVLMRYQPTARGRARNTVCVSTQVGCAMACVFCATGQQGFLRNLSAGEIVAQVLHFARELSSTGGATVANGNISPPGTEAGMLDRRTGHGVRAHPGGDGHITNLVFMGMGEPLANYRHTIAAVRALQGSEQFGLGARHITISTVGLVPMIRRLATERLQVGLALSLHAPDDDLRRQLVPTTAHTIAEMVAAAQEWATSTGRRFSVEYALIDGVNDSPAQARRLATLLRDMSCHVNLIPVNPTANPATTRSRRARVLDFERELRLRGIATTVRVEKGVDIAAGCGQLRGDIEGRHPRTVSDLSLMAPPVAPDVSVLPGDALPEATDMVDSSEVLPALVP